MIFMIQIPVKPDKCFDFRTW